jgi:hypothetical protein
MLTISTKRSYRKKTNIIFTNLSATSAECRVRSLKTVRKGILANPFIFTTQNHFNISDTHWSQSQVSPLSRVGRGSYNKNPFNMQGIELRSSKLYSDTILTELHRLLKFHYRVHKSCAEWHMPSYMNPCFSTIHLYIILPSTPTSIKWSLPFGVLGPQLYRHFVCPHYN